MGHLSPVHHSISLRVLQISNHGTLYAISLDLHDLRHRTDLVLRKAGAPSASNVT
jgi:hypothetical protein